MKWKSITSIILCSGLAAMATPVPFYTSSGVGNLGNAQAWGGSDLTWQDVAFELTFDLTLDMQNSGNPYTLWSAGGSGVGADLVYENGNFHFWAGNGTDDVASGAGGVSAPHTGLQVVAVYTKDVSASNDRLQIFVNGNEVSNVLRDTGNDWAGANSGALGTLAGADTHRYVGTGLFTEANMQDYPNSAISFAVYNQTDPSYDLNALLVPEPSSLGLIMLGCIGLTTRIRRRT